MLNPIFAENEKTIKEESIKIELNIFDLQPTTPIEAIFEEVVIININELAPIAPKEATFEDEK